MISTASGRFSREFLTTCWSIVINGDSAQDAGAAALGELCRRYWYPAYAYLRQLGHPPAETQDIARAFFGSLMHISAAEMPPERSGHFRDFLLDRLRAFLVGERPLSHAVPPLAEPDLRELEERYRGDAVAGLTAEMVYQHGFASEVMARALVRLHAEAREAGHLGMYQALFPYLTAEPSEEDYRAISERLGHRPLALIVALKRLRQRFRDLVGRELADTVDSAGGLAEEQRTLHGILSPRL